MVNDRRAFDLLLLALAYTLGQADMTRTKGPINVLIAFLAVAVAISFFVVLPLNKLAGRRARGPGSRRRAARAHR